MQQLVWKLCRETSQMESLACLFSMANWSSWERSAVRERDLGMLLL